MEPSSYDVLRATGSWLFVIVLIVIAFTDGVSREGRNYIVAIAALITIALLLFK